MERIHQSAARRHSSIKHCRMQGTCFQRWFWSIEFFWWAILPPILLSSELLYWIHLFADVSPVFSEIQNDFKSRHILDGTYKVLKVRWLSWGLILIPNIENFLIVRVIGGGRFYCAEFRPTFFPFQMIYWPWKSQWFFLRGCWRWGCIFHHFTMLTAFLPIPWDIFRARLTKILNQIPPPLPTPSLVFYFIQV